MKRLSISIVMCTYNGAPFVKDQLQSLVAQSRKPEEMVVCDDGSKDETVDIIKQFIPQAPFPVMLIVNKKTLGATRNCEQAISHCKGDVVVFADQDDVSYTDRLQKIDEKFSGNPGLGAILSDSTVVDEQLRPLGYTMWQSIRFNDIEQDLVRSGRAIDVLLKYNIASGAAMAFNVQYKDLVLPVPRGCLSDHWMALMCAAIGEFGMIEEPLIKYRKHTGQQIGPLGNGSMLGNIAAEARKLMTRGRKYMSELQWHKEKEIDEAIRLYWHAMDRLKEKGILSSRPELAKEFDEKIAHLEARKEMAGRKRLFRIRPALKEIMERQYSRYSNGIAYPIEDLLI